MNGLAGRRVPDEVISFWWRYLSAGKFEVKLRKPARLLSQFVEGADSSTFEVVAAVVPADAPRPAGEVLEAFSARDAEREAGDGGECTRFVFENRGFFLIERSKDKAVRKEAKRQLRELVEGDLSTAAFRKLVGSCKGLNGVVATLEADGLSALAEQFAGEVSSVTTRVAAFHEKLLSVLPLDPPVKHLKDLEREVKLESERLRALLESFEGVARGEARVEQRDGLLPAWLAWAELGEARGALLRLVHRPAWVDLSPATVRAASLLSERPRGASPGAFLQKGGQADQAGGDGSLLAQAAYLLFRTGCLLEEVPERTPDDARHVLAGLARKVEDLLLPVLTARKPKRLGSCEKFTRLLPKLAQEALGELTSRVKEGVDAAEFDRVLSNFQVWLDELAAPFRTLLREINRLRPYLGPDASLADKFAEVVEQALSHLETGAMATAARVEEAKKEFLLHDLNEFLSEKEGVLREVECRLEAALKVCAQDVERAISRAKEAAWQFVNEFRAVDPVALETLKRAGSRGLNVAAAALAWDRAREGLEERVRRLLANFLESVGQQFESATQLERDLLGDFAKQGLLLERLPESTLVDPEPSRAGVPPGPSEEHLRIRLERVEARLGELQKLVELYSHKRDQYAAALSDRIRQKEGISSSTCVICHKPVDFARSEVLKCPHCGCISHRLCSLAYIEQHNNCPVCNNSYVVPNSGLFVEEDLEYLDGLEEYRVEEEDDERDKPGFVEGGGGEA